MMRMSKSKIGQYENCPHAFYAKYVEKWKPKEMNTPMKNGILIHDVIDQVTKESSVMDEVLKNMKKHESYKEFKEQFDNVMDFQSWNELPLAHELHIIDDSINFGGIIDRVQKLPAGEVMLIDYKTGNEHDIKYYVFELSAYAYLYNLENENKITHVGIFFTKTGIIRSKRLDDKMIPRALKKISKRSVEINDKIKEGKECFHKKKGILCNYCDLAREGLCEGLNKTLRG